MFQVREFVWWEGPGGVNPGGGGEVGVWWSVWRWIVREGRWELVLGSWDGEGRGRRRDGWRWRRDGHIPGVGMPGGGRMVRRRVNGDVAAARGGEPDPEPGA